MALREVQVINHGTKVFTDKYHGIEYVFKPNEKVLIPVAAAAHIFGTAENKKAAWIRQGFRSESDGLAFLNKFDLEVVNLVPESADVDALKDENESLKARIEELENEKPDEE